MPLQPVLIAGVWRQSTDCVSTFTATDPSTRQPLPDEFPVSGATEVDQACEAGQRASFALQQFDDRHDRIANFLDGYAVAIESQANALADVASAETAYPRTPRLLSVELPRTTNQLRQAAVAARSRSWCLATIDTRANIRSCYRALGGPVVVFGPNNFPFAFNSAAGGDFAAAVAAGNPVIAKANTSHPGTTRLFAELAFAASVAAGLPAAFVQLIYRTPPEAGFRLVSHPAVAATGFTGSKRAGLDLKAAADRAGKPIYLEMSSVNPVFVLPGALAERGTALAKELYDSCALGAGQFCTRPGLTIVAEGEATDSFVAELARHFGAAPAGVLLGLSGLSSVDSAVKTLAEHGADIVVGGRRIDEGGFRYAPTLLTVSGDRFLADTHGLQTEAFATVNTVVRCKDVDQMVDVARALDGSLTGAVYSETTGRDDIAYRQVEPTLRARVGRLLNDKMPTGVAVSPAMNHGGPYPATGHPGFTAVGIPASLLRFAALHSYDNVRAHRLPPELADRNPTGHMWRSIDGEWTKRDVSLET